MGLLDSIKNLFKGPSADRLTSDPADDTPTERAQQAADEAAGAADPAPRAPGAPPA